MVNVAVWDIGYLVAAALFILGIKQLSSPRTAPQGNRMGAMGMFLAVLVTLARPIRSTCPATDERRG